LVLPFFHTTEHGKEGGAYLTEEIASALSRRGTEVLAAKKAQEIFPGEVLTPVALPRLIRKARAEGVQYLLAGKVEKWERFYGVVHSHATCDFTVELYDVRTGREIFEDRYSKTLASGLIKGPTSLAAVAIAPVTGLQKQRSFRNAYDLADLAAGDITQLLDHRKIRGAARGSAAPSPGPAASPAPSAS
jgi:TolB-like protein